MKRASQIINDIQNNKADSLFLDIYQDESMIEFQKKRYVDAIEQYINLYKDEEVEIFSVPGRSEVCGNHTDHQHGQVLATAINLDIITVVSKDEEKVLLKDKYTSNPVYINDLDMKEEEKDTSEGLIRGILYRFKELGYKIGGFKGFSTSNVLAGSGLSSSAAYEGMIGVILSGLYNDMKVDSVEIAKIGQYAENVYFGKPCGLMDQCACAVGGLIHIDFKDNSNPVVEKIDNDFSQYGYSLCIVDVHASHADLTPDYAAIPSEMKEVAAYFGKKFLREVSEEGFIKEISNIRHSIGDRAVARALHYFEEDKRVGKITKALKDNDFETFKACIKSSGDSSFKYLQNIYSNNDINNQAVTIALGLSELFLEGHGVSRVHGGGFAGTIQAFVENNYVQEYKKKIEEKKLADEMITHDIHLTPMIFDADSSFYYTYFKINSLKDWELLKKVYDIHPLKMQVTNFPEIIIAESWFDLEDADICKDEEVFKKFELNLDEMRWEKISVMQQSTIDYWESLGYKINLEKKEEAVSNQNITYATLRVVHP